MDIQYHYFVVKTLAIQGGFAEDEAQTIAYYSQQVDDFTKCQPIYADEKPPTFFIENGFAKQGKNGWIVVPHPTGIDVVQSLEEHYCYTTLAPFHFIPPRTFEETENDEDFTRADYRCVQASDREKAVLINEIIRAAVEDAKEEKNEKNLMQLGMALHTYADTYAHCGYSGLTGWENKAIIKKAFNQKEGKEEVTDAERLFYKVLPHVGHGNSGHVPDICSYQIDVAMLAREDDEDYLEHIKRSNLENFLRCSRDILDILCEASGAEAYSDDQWKELSEKLSSAMLVRTSEEAESKKKALTAHWKKYFPDISYSYQKNQRFYKKVYYKQIGGNAIYSLTQAFYDYNELAYRRAKEVLGTVQRFGINKQMLMESLQNEVSVEMKQAYNMSMEKFGQEQLLYGISAEENVVQERKYIDFADGVSDIWTPDTKLGTTLHSAGFSYLPQEDILYSLPDSVQRTFGYCRAYDETALAAGIVTDCESICFLYGEYEWLLELRKGQYGIGTGGGIGLYHRKLGQEETDSEKKMGKMYSSVSDEEEIDMRFSLCRDGETICEGTWIKQWRLLVVIWGIYSQPEQLSMMVELRFPNEDMKKAFLDGGDFQEKELGNYGLKAMEYHYEEPEEYTVRFYFTKPYTTQPAIRSQADETIQKINEEMVTVYNKIKAKHNISLNDPNVIDEVLTEHGGIEDKKLYEKLLLYNANFTYPRDIFSLYKSKN